MTNEYAKRHVYLGLAYTIIGMGLGIYMAASKDYSQSPTHAHIMLLGCVLSILYGIIFHLWVGDKLKKWANAQMLTHHIGTLGIVIGLHFLYSGKNIPAFVEPMLGISSVIALTGAILALIIFWKADPVDDTGS